MAWKSASEGAIAAAQLFGREAQLNFPAGAGGPAPPTLGAKAVAKIKAAAEELAAAGKKKQKAGAKKAKAKKPSKKRKAAAKK